MDAAHRELAKRGVGLSLLAALIAGVVGGLLLAFLVTSGFALYSIAGASMEPTLAHGDSVVLKKSKDFQRGQLIFFTKPEEWKTPDAAATETVLVKRLVAVPGDVVSYEGNSLLVNGEEVFSTIDYDCSRGDANYRHFLTADELFVMGDNAGVSLDSRRFFCDGKGAIYVNPEQVLAHGTPIAHF